MNPKNLRLKLGLNQSEFWNAVGITQSGGSRYEAGRRMPKPTEVLLKLYYEDGENLIGGHFKIVSVAEHIEYLMMKLKRRKS